MMKRWTAIRQTIGHEWTWPGWLISLLYLAIGLTLWLQPHRYDNTPSYGILLQVLSARTWGFLYIGVALLMIGYVTRFRSLRYAILAHVAITGLTGFWLAAFVVRYVSDSGTTIVNVASWSTYLIIIIRSAFMIDLATLPANQVRNGR